MSPEDLKKEIEIETESIEKIISQVDNLLFTIGNGNPDTIQITALSAFASQIYTGVENILKRISKYLNEHIPPSPDWHIELFKRFCNPTFSAFPLLFDDDLKEQFTLLRKFRHYFFHGYSFNIEWEWFKDGIRDIGKNYSGFKINLTGFLNSL